MSYDEKKKAVLASYEVLKANMAKLVTSFGRGQYGPVRFWSEYFNWVKSNMEVQYTIISIQSRRHYTRETMQDVMCTSKLKSFDAQLFLVPTNKKAKSTSVNPEPSGARQCRKVLRNIMRSEQPKHISCLLWDCFEMTQDTVLTLQCRKVNAIPILYPGLGAVEIHLETKGPFQVFVSISPEKLDIPFTFRKAYETDEHFIAKDLEKCIAVESFFGGIILKGVLVQDVQHYSVFSMQTTDVPDSLIANIVICYRQDESSVLPDIPSINE
jgi:hypothetical protein